MDEDAWNPDVAVSVSGLRKTYAGEMGAVTAVDGISFDIPSGQIVGLLGPNGAGKTTTVKMSLGLVTPTDGTVTVRGVPVHEDRSQAYEHVSAVLEGARNVYWRLSVRGNLEFFGGLRGVDPAKHRYEHDRIVETLGLSGKVDEPVRALSRGMKQKVALGCALAQKTPILFLDEPMLGLDVSTTRDLQEELRRLAREEDKTIVVTSHDMDVVQTVCDRVIVLDDGQVVADDSVENLLGAFETQTYRVEAETDSSEALRETLADRFRLLDWREEAGATTFEVVLAGSDEFFQCVDALECMDVTVSSFTEIEPDLQDAFVDLTSERPTASSRVEP